MDGDDIVKVVEGEPIVTDPLDIWVLDDPARNGHGEIVCLRENSTGDDSLTHYVIDQSQMFAGKCDDYILGYCYEVTKDEDGKVLQTSVYPYKDWETLNTIQRLWEESQRNKRNLDMTSETLVDLDYRQTMMELGLTP